jgi:copper(I)-binding protein
MNKTRQLLSRMITRSVLSLLLASSAYAHEYQIGDLTLDHPHTLATPPGASVAAGYLVISNAGTSGDRLTGGHASFADAVEVHETRIDNDVMKMRELADGLSLPPGASVELSTGGIHLMFTGLETQMMPGDLHTVTLMFEVAGAVEVEFVVEEAIVPMDHTMHKGMQDGEMTMDHPKDEGMMDGKAPMDQSTHEGMQDEDTPMDQSMHEDMKD